MASSSLGKSKVSVAPDGSVYPVPIEAEIQVRFDELASKVEWYRKQGQQVVVVQGLGFVGAAVAVAIASATNASGQPRYYVIGIDSPSTAAYWKVAKLNKGLTPLVSPDAELSRLTHKAVKETRNLQATVSEQAYSLADFIVVDIPLNVSNRLAKTPQDVDLKLEDFRESIRTIGRFMRSKALVLIETTVPVGVCQQVVLSVLNEERARRGIKGPLYLAYAYERVMPGSNYLNSIRRYWRTFAGIDRASTTKARQFLTSFIDTASYPLWELEDIASVELAKLLENSYRAVNIAFIYEWTLLAEQMGVNLFAVIDSIRVRRGTHDNIRFPGFGVGGYCLPKDSLLAQWSSNHLFGSDVVLGMTLDALQINYQMPLHTLDLLKELAEDELRGKKITVCGVSYLPEVADTRNSPTKLLVDELIKAGAIPIVHDPYVATWTERPDIPVSNDLKDCLKQAAGIVFTVPHKAYYQLSPKVILANASSPPFIVDAQNIISDKKAKLLHDAGCRLVGVGKGHWRKRGYQCPK